MSMSGSVEKVAVAMSGGVDSSYAAGLLLQPGYEVEGVCFDLYEGSRAPEQALAAGDRLGIPVHIRDQRQRFRDEIIEYFCRSYHAGITPDPCAICNPRIKFHYLLEAAAELGAEKIATGHYVRCVQDQDSGIYSLYMAVDGKKDQSYFMYSLGQDALRYALFPLGELTKTQVRAAAALAGLPAAAAKDSQEICFIPDGDYVGYLRRHAERTGMAGGLIPGDFVDETGQTLGRHQGLACYTIGQRKNLGASFGRRLYVLALDARENRVTVGADDALYTRDVATVSNVFACGTQPTEPIAVEAKLRSGAAAAKAVYHPMEGDCGELVFEDAQRAVTPGQCAVYYRGESLLGGGIIA
jgi:tRNA-specific 2-thiouridylase